MALTAEEKKKRKENKLVEQLLTINEEDIRNFRGNPLLKRAGEATELSAKHIKEYKKCMKDPVYFAERYIKIVHVDKGLIPITLYDYQKRILKALKENRFNIILSCRQSGKTTIIVCFLLWFVIFHADKRCAILANKGATARQIVGRIELAYMNLPKWLQQGVSDWNKGSFGLENGSSIMSAATSSDSVRGESYSCVKGNTKVTILDDNENIYYIPIDKCNQIQQGTNNMNKKYYYVYKITNNLNNKEYIGYHSTNDLNDGYMGSGKLLIKAIEKYGIENFSKVILKFFDDKKSAEEYERFLVNEEYVQRKDTYNLTTGGNVCILRGEKNGFYGKKHSKETIERIKKSKQGKPVKYPKSIKTTELKIGFNTFNSFNEACKFTGLTRREINILIYYDKNCYIIDKEKHNKFIVEYEEYLKEKELKAKLHWVRVREYMKSDKHRQEVSKANKGKPHPWVIETNKNPEKIEKTAAKHRGMKRSPETCQKISNSLKKIKVQQ